MLPPWFHPIIPALAVIVAIISNPTALLTAFLDNEIVRIGVVVVVGDVVYLSVKAWRGRNDPTEKDAHGERLT
jgi:hypothetical protein